MENELTGSEEMHLRVLISTKLVECQVKAKEAIKYNDEVGAKMYLEDAATYKTILTKVKALCK